MRLILVSFMLFLTGCPRHHVSKFAYDEHERVMKTWVGKSRDRLIQVWGVPTRQIDMDNGGKVYEYFESSGAYSSGYANAWGYNGNTVAKYCKTTFFLNSSGAVDKYDWEGNTCY